MSIEKSESAQGSSRFITEQRLAEAKAAIRDAKRTKMNSSDSSISTVKPSRAYIGKRSSRRATTGTTGESGACVDYKGMTTAALAAIFKAEPEVPKGVRSALLERANKGDEAAYAVVSPELENVYEGLSILGKTLRKSMVERFIGKEEKVVQAMVARDIQIVEESLLDANSTPLERILAGRIATCQATLEYFETHFMQYPNVSASIQLVYQGRISMAQARLVQAVKALAQFRRLQLPNVQVNIGEKQVNLA
jgi:hypothetical protein